MPSAFVPLSASAVNLFLATFTEPPAAFTLAEIGGLGSHEPVVVGHDDGPGVFQRGIQRRDERGFCGSIHVGYTPKCNGPRDWARRGCTMLAGCPSSASGTCPDRASS